MADRISEEEFREIQMKAEQSRTFAHRFAAVNNVPHYEAIRVAETMDKQLVGHPHYDTWKSLNQDAAKKLEESVSRAERVNSGEKPHVKDDKERERE